MPVLTAMRGKYGCAAHTARSASCLGSPRVAADRFNHRKYNSLEESKMQFTSFSWQTIPIRLEAIAIRLEAIAIRLEAIAIRLETIAIR